MTVLLLLVLIITEIGFAVYELTRRSSRKEWSIRRLMVNGSEILIFILMLLLPGIDTSFRFKGLIILLTIRLIIAGISAFIRRRDENEKKKSLKVISGIIGIMLITMSLVPAFVITDYNGRPLTGEYEVGTKKAILIDRTRTEEFESDGSSREVPVYFYYPKDYTEGKNTLPLVIFSHGAFGYYQSNASTYMELASHGYVVVSLDHPYHSFFTKDSTGKTITVDPQFIQDVMIIGGTEDSGGHSEEEVYAYTSKWVKLRIDDENFVVDTLKEAAGGSYSDAWFFTDDDRDSVNEAVSLINADKIGLMGHSLGGAAAVTVGRRDDIGAVIDLDGSMLGEETGLKDGKVTVNEDPYNTPLLCIDSASHRAEKEKDISDGYNYSNNIILKNAAKGYDTYFENTLHMNFTDLPLFSPILARNLGAGSVDPARCIDEMNVRVLDFFDAFLKGEGDFAIKECY